jgi:transposase
VPAMPVSLLEPVWHQVAALLPERPRVDPARPLGCHRPRAPDRVVFEHVVAALVPGSGYARIARPGCSDRTIRRRVHEWAEAGLAAELQALVLAQYDRGIGLDLDGRAVDGCVSKAPCGGEAAGRSPVGRGKQGPKRSTVTDAQGIPLHPVAAGANRSDAPRLGPALAGLAAAAPRPAAATVHLDRADDGAPSRALRDELGFAGAIARRGVPAPLQAGKRRVVERTQSWLNGYGKLRRCTEKRAAAVDFSPFLAAAFVVVRRPIQRARPRSRWPGRPTARRLK